MSQLVDTLVTRYTLDPSRYKRGAEEVKRSSKSAGDSIKRLKDTASSLHGAFSSVGGAITGLATRLKNLGAGILRFGAIAAVGLGALAGYAINAAVEFDTLKRRLEGIVGDSEKAAQIWKSLKKLAADSMFELAPVADAAILLSAYGIDAEKWTRLAVIMGSAFGATADKLADFTAILGRLKGGQITEALGPEGVGRFGITRDLLKQYGAVFDSNNSFVGSAEEAMDLIERIIIDKFGAIADSMEGGPMAKLASFWDSVKFSLAEVGSVLLEYLLPHIETLTSLFMWLSQSGILTDLTHKLLSIFNMGASESPLVHGILLALSFIYEIADALPKLLQRFNITFDGVKEIISIAVGVATTGFGILVVAAIASAVTSLITLGTTLATIIGLEATAIAMTGVGIALVIAAIGAGVFAYLKMKEQMDNLRAEIDGASGGLFNMNRVEQRASDWEKEFAANQIEAPEIPEFDLMAPQLDAISKYTKATADNTQKQLDMQRYVLGGGDLARLGVTAVEMRGRASQSSSTVKVYTGNKYLDEWLRDALGKMVIEMKRRGEI